LNYVGACSGVGVWGKTGSGENGSEDCVMDTSDSGAGGGGNGIAHTRGTGNSSYSGGESGASDAPAAAVDHFIRKTDLNPVIVVDAASTAPNVSSVVIAASAGANDNGSGWGDFEKPLDILLAEELEMWKKKANHSMDEGAQEDAQLRQAEVKVAALTKTARKMMSAGSAEVIQIELNGYEVLWSKDNTQRTKTQNAQSTRHSKIKFGRRGIGHEKQRVWSISFVTKAGKRNESQWRNGCPTRRWRSNTASGTDRRGVTRLQVLFL